MSLKSIQSVIDKYSRKYDVFSISKSLDKKSGRFKEIATKKVAIFTMFQKKYKKVFGSGGEHVEADIKIYSNVELEKNNEIDNKYKITFVDKRVECEPAVYICYGVLIDDN